MASDDKWWENRDWTHTFGLLLKAADVLTEVDSVFHYFEKPWKWTKEYEAYVVAGEPNEGGPGWDDWIKVLADL